VMMSPLWATAACWR